MPESPLLCVEDLHVTYHTPTGPVQAVKGVSFEIFCTRIVAPCVGFAVAVSR